MLVTTPQHSLACYIRGVFEVCNHEISYVGTGFECSSGLILTASSLFEEREKNQELLCVGKFQNSRFIQTITGSDSAGSPSITLLKTGPICWLDPEEYETSRLGYSKDISSELLEIGQEVLTLSFHPDKSRTEMCTCPLISVGRVQELEGQGIFRTFFAVGRAMVGSPVFETRRGSLIGVVTGESQGTSQITPIDYNLKETMRGN